MIFITIDSKVLIETFRTGFKVGIEKDISNVY